MTEKFPLMAAGFHTSVSDGRGGRYELSFKFPTLEAMQAAGREWSARNGAGVAQPVAGDEILCGCGDGITPDSGAKCGNCAYVDSLHGEKVLKDAARYRWLRAGMTWGRLADGDYEWKCFRKLTTKHYFGSPADDLQLNNAIDEQIALLPLTAAGKEGEAK